MMGLLSPGKGWPVSLFCSGKPPYVLRCLEFPGVCDLVTHLACSWRQSANYNRVMFCLPARSRGFPQVQLRSAEVHSSQPRASPASPRLPGPLARSVLSAQSGRVLGIPVPREWHRPPLDSIEEMGGDSRSLSSLASFTQHPTHSTLPLWVDLDVVHFGC